MLELLLIVLLLMLLRTATATLLLSFYYQPGTKHRSHTHRPRTKTWNNRIQKLQELRNWTLYNEPLLTRLYTSCNDFTTVHYSPPRMPISLDCSWWPSLAYPQGLHCSWDRAPEVTALMSWRERLYETRRRQFFASLFRSQVSKHRKRMEERDGA